MNAELVTYLSRYMPITDEIADVLTKSSFVQTFPRGTVLLREGDPVRKGYFILKGCIRSYILKNGEDKTIEFFIEEEPVLPIGYGRGCSFRPFPGMPGGYRGGGEHARSGRESAF